MKKYVYKSITKNGKTTTEQRFIMEEKLGRKLKDDKIVHHINGITLDNRVENLKVLTYREHNLLHERERRAKGMTRKSCKMFTYQGTTQSMKAWSESKIALKNGVTYRNLKRRLKKGWDFEKAITTISMSKRKPKLIFKEKIRKEAK